MITRENFRWRSLDGNVYTLETFADSHLLNVDRFVRGRGELEFPGWRKEPDETRQVLALLAEEINNRGLEPLNTTHPEAVERFERKMMFPQLTEAYERLDKKGHELLDALGNWHWDFAQDITEEQITKVASKMKQLSRRMDREYAQRRGALDRDHAMRLLNNLVEEDAYQAAIDACGICDGAGVANDGHSGGSPDYYSCNHNPETRGR